MVKENYEEHIDELLKTEGTDFALRYGLKRGQAFTEEEILEKIQSDYLIDKYVAFGAIQKRKMGKALPLLKYMALYNEDVDIQEEAIKTIRKIGGGKALDILRFLKTTEHKDFVEHILSPKADLDD